jgi:two-component system, NarL family, nitrate/nitrite response regulator NarL
MGLPIVVTHPSILFHNGLRNLLAKSRFRPVRIATLLTDELEEYLRSQPSCVWLTGVEKSISATNALVRKVVTANSGVKAVILAPSQKPEEILAALRAGACGFLSQDIAADRLLRSLELIALGEMIVHPQVAWDQAPNAKQLDGRDNEFELLSGAGMQHAQRFETPCALSASAVEENGYTNSDSLVPALSRREMLILRMLMQGASNKKIARNLVITESTVKVHMKAILRKLRLQNRTQAAMWARNHVNEGEVNQRIANGSPAH